MIQRCDFIKMFIIHNANRFEDPQDCMDEAERYENLLDEDGYFDQDVQVVPNDFLIDLHNIAEAIKSLKE